jgi:hypothetical protein
MKVLSFFTLSMLISSIVMANKGLDRTLNNDIAINNVNFWVTADDGDGMVHTIGIVENKSMQNHYKVRLKVIYLDAKGAPLQVDGWLSTYKNELEGSNSSSVPGDIATIETIMIEKGKKSYFHQFRSVTKLKGAVKNVKIEIERVDKCTKEYDMTLSNITSKAESETKTIWDGSKVTYDYGIRIKGTIKNVDSEKADIPKIAILLIGEDGKIWGDKVIDCTMSGLNSVNLSKYKSLGSGESLEFNILCEPPQIDLKGKTVKIAKYEIFGYKEISYF